MTSEKTSLKVDPAKMDPTRWQSDPAREKQSAARVVLEACAGRTLSDLEWDRAGARLLDFVSILRDWHRKNATIGFALPKAA